MSSPKQAEDYTIGWIAALHKELTAAWAVVDEEHAEPEDFTAHPKDTNSYVWGRIGDHNIVIASLADGKTGNVSAATTAMSMTSSLPHLRFGLMVGIGAGIPRLAEDIDIRLGDVVVSTSVGSSPAVVQYDLGKQKDDQFELKGALANPPDVLQKGLTKLRSKQRMEGSQISTILDQMIRNKPNLAKAKGDDAAFFTKGHRTTAFLRLRQDGQKAAERTGSCVNCDLKKEIVRQKRESTEPEVHYGVIASGDSVVKGGVSRDEILRRLDGNCMCIEMEADGLMDHFPCLVVRGICDYADMHKNDQWQNYAAATAAAFTKELLQVLDAKNVEKSRRIDQFMGKINENISQVHQTTRAIQDDLHFQQLKQWISAPDPSINYNKALGQRHEGTGKWFLDNGEYSNWKTAPGSSSLWLHGFPGCGKTILISTIVQDLIHNDPCTDRCVYFYFDFNYASTTSFEHAIRSLVIQVYTKFPNAREPLDSLHSLFMQRAQQPGLEVLCKAFETMVQQTGEIWIVIDALDECKTGNGAAKGRLLSWIKSVLNLPKSTLHLIAASRPEADIELVLKDSTDYQVSIQSDLVSDDICSYIQGRLECGGLDRWDPEEHDEARRKIESNLIKKSNGMFRWVQCQLDALEGCLNEAELDSALNRLPKTLDETYKRIWDNVPSTKKDTARKILQFLAFSERPLRLKEAADAIVVFPTNKPRFDTKNRMPRPREITNYCSSLIIVSPGENGVEEVQLAHLSVKEFLVSNDCISQHFTEPSARGLIAEVCLVYLLELDHSAELKDVRRRFPLAQYASQYWMKHAISSDTGTVRELIVEFLRSRNAYTTCFRLHGPDRQLEGRPSVNDTPVLHNVAHGGVEYAVEEALKNGADVNEQGGRFANALQAASGMGHEGVVRILLDHGADVNAVGGLWGNALAAASWAETGKVAKMLLERGAAVSTPGGQYGKAIQVASLAGNEEVVRILIENGADMYESSGTHGTALNAAAFGGKEEVVDLLIRQDESIINKPGEDGLTPVWHALFNRQVDIVELLLEKGADATVKHMGGLTLLHGAASIGHFKMFKVILDMTGLDPEDVDPATGWTALACAAWSGGEQIVQLLLEKQLSNPLTKDVLGRTPLFHASFHGHAELFNCILQSAREAVDLKDYYGVTPLSVAARKGRVEVVKALLATDAVQIDSRDFNDKTPLWWAKRCGHDCFHKGGTCPEHHELVQGEREDW
ncbi:hypothetical protein CkaCkLH20_08955 [Colletotrichum karsti]|uniref:NACHT domain-containing protein n=1 Tax=Colletotrichum karsti TaxID=1095194 RepID=A0A9P6LHS9_9PEZI|nr:uncharacterized protein CkaCkLH20_08955 [Colletotrichum karsti]KAF9873496.1 hypothetical protein CkaCkLH20_08955 [Colletotrichum karsti]